MNAQVQKKAGRPPKAQSTKAEDAKVEVKEEVVEKVARPIPQQFQPSQKKAPSPKRDMDELIQVISIRPNPLIYVSKNQVGYEIEWSEYGAENWIEYRELINMKNGQLSFFKKNWILCDHEVLCDLKVDKFYSNMIDLDNIEGLFSKPLVELKSAISASTDGVKQLVFDKALEMYKEERLDSIKVKNMLKEEFQFDIDLVL